MEITIPIKILVETPFDENMDEEEEEFLKDRISLILENLSFNLKQGCFQIRKPFSSELVDLKFTIISSD